MSDPVPKLRWSRFSLRTLFVVVTVCALAAPVLPVLVAKYREWERERSWEEVGGPGRIAPFEPISCSFGDDKTEAETEER